MGYIIILNKHIMRKVILSIFLILSVLNMSAQDYTFNDTDIPISLYPENRE
jgi:hypothetical protein